MPVKKLGKAVLGVTPYGISEYFPRHPLLPCDVFYWIIDHGTRSAKFSPAQPPIIEKMAPEIETLRQQYPIEKDKRGRGGRATGYFEAVKLACEKIAGEIQGESFEKPIILSLLQKQRGSLFIGDSRYCLYKGNIYRFDRPGYSEEEMLLQLIDLEDRERRVFERLKNRMKLAAGEKQRERERIPEELRIAVWRRDSGKCARCGSRERLEYDHIVPLVKGGSNTVRNIELLCEKCNREKSANIG